MFVFGFCFSLLTIAYDNLYMGRLGSTHIIILYEIRLFVVKPERADQLLYGDYDGDLLSISKPETPVME